MIKTRFEFLSPLIYIICSVPLYRLDLGGNAYSLFVRQTQKAVKPQRGICIMCILAGLRFARQLECKYPVKARAYKALGYAVPIGNAVIAKLSLR